MAQSRNDFIDFCKGFLMLGVIWGHTITSLEGGISAPVFIHTFFRTYDMPFFMILSGFFLGKSLSHNQVRKTFVNRITMVLLPVLLWNLLARNIHFSSFYFLFAVFVSSTICIGAYSLGRVFSQKGRYVEFCIEVASIIILHFVSIPWNMFYLFPFFVVGRYLPNINFRLKNFKFFLFAFVFLLCFWQVKYTPWNFGFDAWQNDSFGIVIYVYRFVLGVLGTYIIANVLKVIYNLNGGGYSMLVKCGRQTLAIYILQSFFVGYLQRFVTFLVQKYDIAYSQIEINIIGYIAAPIVALTLLKICSLIVDCFARYRFTKYLFGFKLIK